MWGDTSFGAAGLNTATSYSSPKQVGSLTNWSTLSMGGFYTAYAVKTDGTAWSWGYGGDGGLGLGSTTSRSSPTQIGALTDWLAISAGYYHAAAVKTNGTIWTWGGNSVGQLGLNNSNVYSSPKQVGALTTWATLKAGSKSQNYGVKTDGTLWVWGAGTNGALGNGSTTDRFSPVQIGALTTWANVYPGMFFCQATTTLGALWTWGGNSNGELGLGNTTNYSSPKQVGTGTGWILPVRSSASHTIAIR
jgi:alpha-tubulin suppressor-like RCC1 family protein